MNEEISWRRRGTMLLAALCVLAGLCLLCPSLLEAAQAKEQLVLYLDDGDIVFTGNDRVEQEGQGGDSTYRKDIVITQRDPSVPTAHTITVRGETVISSSFILKDVNIDTCGAATPRPAINIEKREDKSLARAIELTLAPGSQNTLKSGGGCAALQVGGQNQGNRYDPSMLTIKSASDNPGRLTATALGIGAGIGAGAGSAASDSATAFIDIVIEGGIINAKGGTGGTGIGGSADIPGGGHIHIEAGTVTADGGDGADGIGGPNENPAYPITIQIDGGSVQATGVQPTTVTPTNQAGDRVFRNEVTVAETDSANQAVTGGVIKDYVNPVILSYSLKNVYTDADSKLWFYLPANDPDNRDKSFMMIYDLDFGVHHKGLRGEWWVTDSDAPEETNTSENKVQIAVQDTNPFAFKPSAAPGSAAVMYTKDTSKPRAPVLVDKDTQKLVVSPAVYYKDAEGNWSAVNSNCTPVTGYQIAAKEPAVPGCAQGIKATSYEIREPETLTVTAATVDEKTYDGTTAATVTGDVTFGGLDRGVTLKRDTDYTVTAAFDGADVQKDKAVTVTVILLDTEKTAKYAMADSGQLVAKATIVPRTLGNEDIDLGAVPEQIYTGSPILPELEVSTKDTEGSIPLKKNTDYTVAGQNNTNVGAAKLTITLKGNYAGACKACFNIIKAEITGVSFKDENIPCDGKTHSITLEGTLPKGTSVTYENNAGTKPGTYQATAKIEGGANYEDKTLTAVLTINKEPGPNPISTTSATDSGSALKNPVTGLPMSIPEAALLGLSAIALLTLGAIALRRHDAEK